MRILIFLPCFTYGGAEKQAAALATHLVSKGHHVEAWAFPSPSRQAPLRSDLEKYGIICHEVSEWPRLTWNDLAPGLRFGLNLGARWAWKHRLSRFADLFPSRHFDVAIPFTFWPSLSVALLRERLGVSAAIWNHRGGYDEAGMLYSPFLIDQVTCADLQFVANSKNGIQFLKDKFAPEPDRLHLIPNAFLPPTDSNLRSGRSEGHSNRPLQLVQIANHYPEKDFITLLNAFEQLHASNTYCHLHLAGAFRTSEERHAFTCHINLLNSRNYITHHGPLKPYEVNALLDTCDIALLSSRSEGCPNSIMEYMSRELPVIATDIPGIRDLLGEKGPNYLFPVGNAEVLKSLIQSLANSASLRAKLGRQNRTRLLSEFDAGRVFALWDRARVSALA